MVEQERAPAGRCPECGGERELTKPVTHCEWCGAEYPVPGEEPGTATTANDSGSHRHDAS
jgi:uncharacterized protein (DUF983 family)